MSLPFVLTAHLSRPKGDVWRIEHAATHLKATILLPDTDPPSVAWVLPNGQRVDGNVLDADVPAGETLCMCDDFSRCGINMKGNDARAFRLRTAEMPVTRPWLISIPGRYGFMRDLVYTHVKTIKTTGDANLLTMSGFFGFYGYDYFPSGIIMTVEDVNKRSSKPGKVEWTRFVVEHAAGFSGNLADLNLTFTKSYKKIDADFTGVHSDNIVNGALTDTKCMPKIIIHHTNVWGHPKSEYYTPGHYGFYGNPKMTPEDYDQVVLDYTAAAQRLSDAGSLQSALIDPAEFILEISNRRTSASDEAVAALRSIGCNVVEIED